MHRAVAPTISLLGLWICISAAAQTEVHGLWDVTSFSGSTADVQINACLNSIPSGGICDARGYGATPQTIDATVTLGVGASSGTQKLIFSPATVFKPNSASINMFQVGRSGQLTGLTVIMPSSMEYTGKVISVIDTITPPDTFSISDVVIDASKETDPTTGGYCFYMSPPSGSYIQGMTNISNITCNGFEYGFYLTAAGAGSYINGNIFSNITLGGNGTLLTMNSTGLQMNGNIFSGLFMDGFGAEIAYTGTSYIQNNVFAGAYLWDSATPVSNGNSAALRNMLIGNADSTINDSGTSPSHFPYQNVYLLTTSVSSINLGLPMIQGGNSWTGEHNAGTLGWNYTAGQGETDYFNNVYTAASSCAHSFYGANAGGTAYTLLSCITQSGALSSMSGFEVNGGAPDRHYLIGNGTGYVDSQPVSTDLKDSASLVRFVGSLATTGATSDLLAAPAAPAGAGCYAVAQNGAAAKMTGLYVPLVATAGWVAIYHAPAAGAVFSIFCQY